MKPLSIGQIETLIRPKQHFSDCYLVSSLSALARSENGRKILQQNILTDADAYCIKFNNVKGLQEQYLVKQEECDNLILTDKYLEIIQISTPHNPIVKAVEVAMNKLLKLHPDKKPLVSRAIACNEVFEYNRPSNFLEMFTGRKPITLNENTIKNTMKRNKEDVKNLLNMISQDDNSAFIIGTGFEFFPVRLSSWHCYNIEKIDSLADTIILRDNKAQETRNLDFKDISKKFKFICGYFNESLM